MRPEHRSGGSVGTRVELLTAEFQRFGMGRLAAASLSSELVVRHPLAHRVGVGRLRRRFVRHGVAPDDATHLALVLWGLERLMLGACFQQLLDALRRAGVEESTAFPACVEARRLWRQSSDAVPAADIDLQLARWCLVMLGTLLLTSLLLQLGCV